MTIFKNIGHAVASFFLGALSSFTGSTSTAPPSIAEQAGSAAAVLLKIADPQAAAFVNASATAFGDIVQAVKSTGVELKAGKSITFIVSDALEAASKTVWPDVENLLHAFDPAIGSAQTPAAS